MDDCEIEHMMEYLYNKQEILTEKGKLFDMQYWKSRYLEETKEARIKYHKSAVYEAEQDRDRND